MSYDQQQLRTLADSLNALIDHYQKYSTEGTGLQILSKLRILSARGVDVSANLTSKGKKETA